MAEQKKTTTPRKKAATASTEAKKKTATKASTAPKKSAAVTAAPKTSKPRTRKAVASPSGIGRVSEEMRQHMIREAAYYRALNRGFAGTADLEDWLVAEQEISTMLGRLTD